MHQNLHERSRQGTYIDDDQLRNENNEINKVNICFDDHRCNSEDELVCARMKTKSLALDCKCMKERGTLQVIKTE